jgi:hypothetical protein
MIADIFSPFNEQLKNVRNTNVRNENDLLLVKDEFDKLFASLAKEVSIAKEKILEKIELLKAEDKAQCRSYEEATAQYNSVKEAFHIFRTENGRKANELRRELVDLTQGNGLLTTSLTTKDNSNPTTSTVQRRCSPTVQASALVDQELPGSRSTIVPPSMPEPINPMSTGHNPAGKLSHRVSPDPSRSDASKILRGALPIWILPPKAIHKPKPVPQKPANAFKNRVVDANDIGNDIPRAWPPGSDNFYIYKCPVCSESDPQWNVHRQGPFGHLQNYHPGYFDVEAINGSPKEKECWLDEAMAMCQIRVINLYETHVKKLREDEAHRLSQDHEVDYKFGQWKTTRDAIEDALIELPEGSQEYFQVQCFICSQYPTKATVGGAAFEQWAYNHLRNRHQDFVVNRPDEMPMYNRGSPYTVKKRALSLCIYFIKDGTPEWWSGSSCSALESRGGTNPSAGQSQENILPSYHNLFPDSALTDQQISYIKRTIGSDVNFPSGISLNQRIHGRQVPRIKAPLEQEIVEYPDNSGLFYILHCPFCPSHCFTGRNAPEKFHCHAIVRHAEQVEPFLGIEKRVQTCLAVFAIQVVDANEVKGQENRQPQVEVRAGDIVRRSSGGSLLGEPRKFDSDFGRVSPSFSSGCSHADRSGADRSSLSIPASEVESVSETFPGASQVLVPSSQRKCLGGASPLDPEMHVDFLRLSDVRAAPDSITPLSQSPDEQKSKKRRLPCDSCGMVIDTGHYTEHQRSCPNWKETCEHYGEQVFRHRDHKKVCPASGPGSNA